VVLVTVHKPVRAADDDRWCWECICGAFLTYDVRRIKASMDEHLEHEVVPNPLTELAILEAKQRHPSRRGLR
jgi:hypothetical protein